MYLVNAESGFGKTTLGMTLSLLPPCEGLTPLYVDLADADREDPLAEIEAILERLWTREEGRPSGRPLFVIDAMNETVDPFRFCERLALKGADLDRADAKLLFLFSFRHRSYPARVRRALLAHELGPIEEIELLFDLGTDSDLAFFPELLPRSGRLVDAKRLRHELRAYCERFTTGALSREDLAAYVRWRGPRKVADPRRAPSPGSLRFEAIVGAGLIPGPALDKMCDLAFALLSEEVTASSYAEITSTGYAKRDVRAWVEQSGLDGFVRCDEQYVRFQGETTVRVLSALSVARRLSVGSSPLDLRGRTSYDVCAPYLQPATQWTTGDGEDDPGGALVSIADAISEALRGRDAPYSFYATAFCSDRQGVFGDCRRDLDTALFRQMIVAIDEDRGQTCKESLETAGRSRGEPTLDPVLDQLFEVMAAYSRRAVTLLLETMTESPAPLVKSQAAYLLLDWVENVPVPLRERDQRALETIPGRLPEDEGNLHFRFHEVEILEKLVERFSDLPELNAAVLAKAEKIAGSQPDRVAAPEVGGIYENCQRLVTKRAEYLLHPDPREQVRSDMVESTWGCMADIEGDPSFRELGRAGADELRLECWEVTLSLAAWLCPRTHRTLEITSFVETALEHPFWIVRWWAFDGLLKISRAARRAERKVLAEKCLRRATEQLCASVEPMGVKHRQCALTKRLLDDGDVEASQAARRALREAFDRHLSGHRKHVFTEGYYEVMGTSPDGYLSEFFRRMAELVPTASR